MIQLNDKTKQQKLLRMIMIRSRQVNLPCSSVEFRLVSISDLLCSVDFCHYDAMFEAKNIVKDFQIHLF